VNDLSGKIAVVTGGGRGLGEQIVRVLARAGAGVIAADVRHDLAEGVASSIRAEGGRADARRLDVSDPAQVDEAVRAIVQEYGRLDIVVNNAALDVTVSIDELKVEDWNRIVAVNLTGPFLLAKAAFGILGRSGGGHIVNIASTASKRAWANAAAYHATKWGLLGLSHALHVEGRAQGIQVTAVVSGGMRTPFLLDRFPDIDPGVLQDPRNVAETVLFVLTRPPETVIPEITVLPMRETSWP
jgi:NAD(P)-dependent dehydrogenase (short-subunit alcohol dehydrogenase family)